MEIPDKIYLQEPTKIRTEKLYSNDVEYIRTDGFIEKAQLYFIDKLNEIPMGNGKMKIKADCSLEDFIEDFGNYMKGE
jgi:hypothetical protein